MILLNVTVDMVIKGLSCIEVTMIKNSDVDCAGINVYCLFVLYCSLSFSELYCLLSICLNRFRFRVSTCFAFDKTVINQRRVEKSAFENQSRVFSVNIKMNDFARNTLQKTFYACCYILLSCTCPNH